MSDVAAPYLAVLFPDAAAKCRYVDGAAREDAADPLVVALVDRLWTPDPWAFCRALHRHVRDRVRYEHDAGGEELAGAGVVLARGWDDCDGKARVFVAGCLRYGLEAAVRCVFDLEACPDRPEHFQAVVRLRGRVVLAELTLRGVELGEGAEAGLVGPDGEYLLA